MERSINVSDSLFTKNIMPAFLLFTILALAACGEKTQTHIQDSIFGTTYSVQIVHDKALDKQQLHDRVHNRLQQIDAIMSTWKADSNLTAFNQHSSGEWFTVPAELGKLISTSRLIYQRTEGAFDPTVGPLIRLWGFSGKQTSTIPLQHEIDVALSQTGMNAIEISPDNTQLRKNKNVTVDLSAIAKGYAVDEIANLLLAQDITSFFIEIGGEIRTHGSKNGSKWTIGIEKPQADTRDIQLIVEANDIAMATSGDYRNFFERKGKRYSHIINPQTGYPVQHNLVSVSVLAENCATADAYATAFMVLGGEKALALANRYNLAVYLLTANKNGILEETYSTSFIQYLQQ